jgi:predicted ester cyclase
VLRGTHRGEFMRVPPTGNLIQVGAVDIARFEGGKVVEQWGQTDLLGLMHQIGGLPPAG